MPTKKTNENENYFSEIREILPTNFIFILFPTKIDRSLSALCRLAEICRLSSQPLRTSVGEQLTQYWSEVLHSALSTPALAYWQQKAASLPLLSSFAEDVLSAIGVARILSRVHFFLPKKLTTFYLVVALKDHLNIPPNLTRPARTSLKLTLALAGGSLRVLGGALTHFPCK